ncbi:MAG: hypothetical protein WA374_20620 [Acidobacteriaceae bacterium]
MTKLVRAGLGAGLLLFASCATAGIARGQDLAPAGSGSPGMHGLPSEPSQQSTDLVNKYKDDPLMLHALREQARLRGEERQKQIVEATALLLRIAQDLRKEMANPPEGMTAKTEADRLDQIEKLAHMIQNREKTEDGVSTDLSKAGVWP